jgi:hypothetical protein
MTSNLKKPGGFFTIQRQLKIAAGMFSLICLLAPFPAKAEWDPSDSRYISDKFKAFLRSTIKNAKVKDSDYVIGVPLSELRSRCSSLENHGRPTWDQGRPAYGKAYYAWFPNIDAVCWEFIKQAIPLAPFNLVNGVNESAITRVDYVPFSDPGPSIFFYFGKGAEKKIELGPK